MLESLADRPLLPPARLADVARLGRQGENLGVTTRLPPTDGQCRVPVTDLDGPCAVNVTALHRRWPVVPAEPSQPDAVLFEWFKYDRPGVTEESTTIQVLPINVQLSRVTETAGGGGGQILLIEQRHASAANAAAGGDPGVRLEVMDAGDAAHPAPPTLRWTADTFAGLCRLHPGAVARYIEPILRDLHADADVLAPDTPLAYQVFAAEATVDEATAARVRQLVAQLDADDFRDRDDAGERLRAMGPIAAVALGRMDAAKLSPEQRARTAAVLRHFRPVTDADAQRLRGNVDFLLNCLNDTDPFVSRIALDRVRAVVGHDVPFDPRLTGRPRREAVWRLRCELAPRDATTGPTTAPS